MRWHESRFSLIYAPCFNMKSHSPWNVCTFWFAHFIRVFQNICMSIVHHAIFFVALIYTEYVTTKSFSGSTCRVIAEHAHQAVRRYFSNAESLAAHISSFDMAAIAASAPQQIWCLALSMGQSRCAIKALDTWWDIHFPDMILMASIIGFSMKFHAAYHGSLDQVFRLGRSFLTCDTAGRRGWRKKMETSSHHARCAERLLGLHFVTIWHDFSMEGRWIIIIVI